MSAPQRLWVLGAPDPEMAAIERLLLDAGEAVVHATAQDGSRVTPARAYDATLPAAVAAATIYEVECMVTDRAMLVAPMCITIDHHRPGDPGYGRHTTEFLPASSLGQVLAEMARVRRITESSIPGWTRVRRSARPDLDSGWCDGALAIGGDQVHGTGEYQGRAWVGWFAPPAAVALIAAADHCLAAAYRGACPGVDPDALMRWRAESRAAFQRRPVDELLADIERARMALKTAPVIDLHEPDRGPARRRREGGEPEECIQAGIARDMRGMHVPELPEASAREGICFVADGLPDRDGRIKIVCQSGGPGQIRAFIEQWAPAHGLTGIYGDPARGFAGGYLL